MKTISLKEWFEELLGDIKVSEQKNNDSYPFQVRFGCVKMAAPRHERFDIVRDIGTNIIDKIFNRESINESHLFFVFPERHLSVHEQQTFMYNLIRNPNIKNIKSVDIISSSPLMVSDFHREQIRILTWDDDYKHNGQF